MKGEEGEGGKERRARKGEKSEERGVPGPGGLQVGAAAESGCVPGVESKTQRVGADSTAVSQVVRRGVEQVSASGGESDARACVRVCTHVCVGWGVFFF